MKSTLLCLIISFISISSFAQDANSSDEISQMFEFRESHDFYFQGSDGADLYYDYHIVDDTLISGYYDFLSSKIAVDDIDLNNSPIAFVPEQTFNGKNVYKLILFVKEGKQLSLYGMRGLSNSMDLFFPTEEYAMRVKSYLNSLTGGSSFLDDFTTLTITKDPEPKDICIATGDIINDLMNYNLDNYKSEKLTGDYLGFKSYESLKQFPSAVSTSIETNELSSFRSAKVVVMEEINSGASLSSEIREKFNYYTAAYRFCMIQKGFYETAIGEGLYEDQTNFTMALPTDPDVLFASLQQGNNLVISVKIRQVILSNGKYQNSLEVSVARV